MNPSPAAINEAGVGTSFSLINPLFICGMPRSGTTLLMSLLDGHPEILAYAAESHFFLEFVSKARNLSDAERLARAEQKLLHPFQGPYHQKYLSHLSYDSIRTLFRQYLAETNQHSCDFLAGAMFAYGSVSGQLTKDTRYWLDKTPGNERFTEQIFSWWQHAKCIHVMRDPRDVYASWHRRAERHQRDFNIDGFAYSWLMTANYAHKNLRRYGPERYLIVRYEDLVCNTQEQIDRVIKFMGIQDHVSLYSPTKGGGTANWRGNSAIGRSHDGISRDEIGRWQTTAQDHQRDMVLLETLLRNNMINYNYTPELKISWIDLFRLSYYKLRVLSRLIRDIVLRR